MAGWSIFADDGSSLSSCKKFHESFERDELFRGEMLGVGLSYRQSLCLSRPLSALLGNGEAVDLLKLFVDVKSRGGYEAISREGLWEKVGEDQGLSSGLGSAIKLVYHKYFQSSERDFTNTSGIVDIKGGPVYGSASLDGVFMGLGADLKSFALKILEGNKKNDESEEDSTDGDKLGNGKTGSAAFKKVEVVDIDSVCSDLSNNKKDCIDADVIILNRAESADNVIQSATNSWRSSRANGGEEREIMAGNLFVVKDESRGRKRKRQCLSRMLHWMAVVAKDPSNLVIGMLPERSQWRSYGNDQYWKQVLLARKALFLKFPEGLSLEEFSSQKKQKMHPSMFGDSSASAERIRSSRRLLYGSSFLPRRLSNLCSSPIHKRIPVGQFFQAEVPEWTGMAAESDNKWLGTRIWPPGESRPMSLLEWNLSPKPTRDPCGCQFRGSTECIKFHVYRRRMKLKVELGSVFSHWKFHKMGEGAAVSWTTEEEQKFEVVVKENPLSLGKRFWDELLKSFPTKSTEELVSYYFNVFLLRRRRHQNKYSPNNVDSDDETEFIVKSPSLILSPGKRAKIGLNCD